MILGYDAAELHAVFNHFPSALLPASVAFDLLGAWLKRDSLKAAGLWTLLAGLLGTGVAIVTGVVASNEVQHSEQAHVIMATHETLAYIVVAIFGLLAVWRILRRGVWSEKELPVALTAGVIGVALLIYQGSLGGKLMFDHAVGIPTARLEQISAERAGHEHHPGEPAPATQPMPGMPAAPSSTSAGGTAHPPQGPSDTATP